MTTIVLTACVFARTVTAATFADGFISWDVTFPGNAGQFDITNESGTNASIFPDTTFPITTKLSLSGLSLTGDFGSHTSSDRRISSLVQTASPLTVARSRSEARIRCP